MGRLADGERGGLVVLGGMGQQGGGVRKGDTWIGNPPLSSPPSSLPFTTSCLFPLQLRTVSHPTPSLIMAGLPEVKVGSCELTVEFGSGHLPTV